MRWGLPLRRRTTVVVAAGVAVAVAAVVVWQLSGGRTAAAKAVTTQPVRRGTLTVTASAAGTVQPIDSRALTFGTGGTLATLAVKPGDHVTAGQLLATLDPTDAQAAVTSAQSALDAAETNLTLAEDQAAAP